MKKHHAYIVKWRDSACLRGWQPIDSADHGVAVITGADIAALIRANDSPG